MSSFLTILTVLVTILILYALLCFLAHYLDFGWKLISGSWLHEEVYLIKRVRSGLVHQFLIGLILTVLMYGGFSQMLGFLPSDWGRVDEAGQLHPYRTTISSSLALLVASITMYGFHMADRAFENQNEAKR